MTTLAQVEGGTTATMTLTLNSLASDTNLLAGRGSTAQSNATNKYDDYHVAGKIKMGTTPTANTVVEVWAIGAQNDTPAWPDAFTGTDGNISMTSRNVLFGFGKLVVALQNDATTTGRIYYFGPVSIAQLFGGIVPIQFGIYVVHNCVAALDASAGGSVYLTGVQYTST